MISLISGCEVSYCYVIDASIKELNKDLLLEFEKLWSGLVCYKLGLLRICESCGVSGKESAILRGVSDIGKAR